MEKRKQTQRTVNRSHDHGYQRNYGQSFAPVKGLYTHETFQRGLGIKHNLFKSIMNDVEELDYFYKKKDCIKKLGRSFLPFAELCMVWPNRAKFQTFGWIPHFPWNTNNDLRRVYLFINRDVRSFRDSSHLLDFQS